MWLARQVDAVLGADRPVLLLGGEPVGTPKVLDALRSRRRAAWWTLPRAFAGDDVAQGNALAEALNDVLEAPLFSQALPYRAHLQLLRQHAAGLLPLWLVVTAELADAPLLDDLAGLAAAGFGVVIDLRDVDTAPSAAWAPRCLRLGRDKMRLSLAGLHPLALRLFAGPADLFAPVWDAVGGGGPRLRLRFFGGVACRWDGGTVELAPRLAEVALALTLAPDGMSRERLNDFLTPDDQPPFTSGGLRSLLTRLRGLLPVSEAPYRWTVPFAADVAEVRGLLAEGRVREAIGPWQGPLLPFSEAPGVREARETLEEALRQAALLSGDADALYELADRWGDDLELREAAAAAMPPGEPRLALALARVRRLAAEYR